MTEPDTRAWLRVALQDLALVRTHLAFSSARVASIDGTRAAQNPEDLERVEAYTGRFARVVDLLAMGRFCGLGR